MYLETEETKAREKTPELRFEHAPTVRPRLDQLSKLVAYFCARCGEAHQVERSIGRMTDKMCKCGIKLSVIQDDRSGEVCAVGWKPMADKESQDGYERWVNTDSRASASKDQEGSSLETVPQADADKTWSPAEGAG